MRSIKLLSIIVFSLFINFSYAQKEEKVDEKTKHYFKNTEFHNDYYHLYFNNIVSKFEYLKFGFKIVNKTEYFLIWNSKGSKIVFDWGTKEQSKTKIHKIKPYGTGRSTFGVKGGTQMLVSSFKFQQSKLASVSVNGKVAEVEDFKLPENRNSITTKDFEIVLKKAKRKTDETYAKFEIRYIGDKVAVVKPNKISVRVNEDDEFANNFKKNGAYLLLPREKMMITVKFNIARSVVDMQFADMFIQWNDALSISKQVEITGVQSIIVLDKGLTDSKRLWVL